MPKVLLESDIDPIAEEVDLVLTQAEEEAASRRFAPTGDAPDLSDGGMVNGARLIPMSGGKKLAQGRATVRRAWMWNGTESMLPLAWNPDGTRHDGGRHYLRKRYCLCCHAGGFIGAQCPSCVKKSCPDCGASSDRKKIISCFYLRKGDVPFPTRFYGSIDCFLPFCIRRDGRGFLTEEDMRIHARSRHRMEYQAHMEVMAARKGDEVAELRRRLDALMAITMVSQASALQGSATVARAPLTPVQQRMAKARAAKKQGTTQPVTAG